MCRVNLIMLAALLFFGLGEASAQQPPQCPPGKFPVVQGRLYRPFSSTGEGGGIFIVWGCLSKADAAFKGATFDIFPSFVLLTIMYTPPGNQSEVKYASGSSIGSHIETLHTFKAGLAIHAETNFSQTDFEALQGTANGSALELKKEQGKIFSLNSQTDTVTADNDYFYMWVNPEVQIVQTDPNSLTTVYTTPNGAPMIVVPVPAGWLRDPSKMPAYMKTQLAKLTDQDRQNILALDPRVSGQALEPHRFQKTNTSIQLDGPASPTGSIPGEGLSISNENVSSTISGTTSDVSVSFLFGAGVDFGVDAKFFAGVKLEDNYESTQEASTGAKQEAEATLKTSTVGYHDVVDVYFDTLFNSFAFVSQTNGTGFASRVVRLTGIVRDPRGRPLSNKRLAIRLPDGSRRILFTDSRGSYNAFNIGAGKVEVSIQDQKTMTTVNTTKPTSLNIKLNR